ncbi:diacylglycerol kinase [Joostella sp. CR20]|uniref:diacylglycerol kinase n=1 Tax=Joostella sp. CR20 TaxID=2804312 RepID=UPI00313E2EF2
MSFIINRLKSIRYACRGAYLLLKTEASIQTQFVIAVLVTIAGFYFEISTTEWILQTLTIALIMSIEGMNTAIEKIADFIHPDHHYKIGFIKDIAAGAVCIAAFAAVIIGFIIYIPKIF